MATLTTTFVTIGRATRSGEYSRIGPVANVAVSDNSYCTFPSTQGGDPSVAGGGAGYSQWLTLRELNTKVPTGATINGVTLRYECKRGSNLLAGRDSSIRIIKAGSAVGADKADTGTNYATSDTVVSRGGASDLWSTTWTDSEINATNFGFNISVYMDDGNETAENVSIDYVEVVIDYTTGPQNWTSGGTAAMAIAAAATGTITPGPGQYTRTYQFETWTTVARSGSSFGWSNAANAQTSDDARAQTTGMQGNNGGGGYTTFLQGTKLIGADLPPENATINGIKINVERSTDPTFMTGVRDSVLSLVRAGTIEGISKAATGTNWPVTTDATANYGGTSDLWSGVWTVSDLINAGFGVALSVANFTGTGVASAGSGRVDQITAEITFTVPSGGTNWESGGTAQMSLAASSNSQHAMNIGASANMAMNASAAPGTAYQSFMAMSAAADGLAIRGGAAAATMAMATTAAAKLTFSASAGSGLAMSAAASGFRVAQIGATANLVLTTSATSPLFGAGSAAMAIVAAAIGTPRKSGSGSVAMAITGAASGTRFQSGAAAASMAMGAIVTGTVVKIAGGTATMAIGATINQIGLTSGGSAAMAIGATAGGSVRAGVGGSAAMAITGVASGARIILGQPVFPAAGISFDGSVQSLAATSQASLESGNHDWAVYSVCTPNDLANLRSPMSKYIDATNGEWQIQINTTTVRLTATNGTAATTNTNSNRAFSNGSQIAIIGQFTAATLVTGTSIATERTVAFTGPVPSVSALPFTIGAQSNGNGRWIGTIQVVAIWSRALTSVERDFLYNGDSGRSYWDVVFLMPSILSGLSEWWELNTYDGTNTIGWHSAIAATKTGASNTLALVPIPGSPLDGTQIRTTVVGAGLVNQRVGANVALTLTSVVNGVMYKQTGATANMAMAAAAAGFVTRLGAGSAAMAISGASGGVRGQFGGGSAQMAVSGSMSGVRVAQGAGNANMAFSASSGSNATLIGRGSANMAMVAAAFFPSQFTGGSANMAMAATATGRINARVGATASMNLVARIDSAIDYVITGKVAFEIDAGDTVRFTV